MSVYVHEGFCAYNLDHAYGGSRWIGIIEGHRFCKKERRTRKKAYEDAKKLYDKFKTR